jgi:hypothetical protein
VPTDLSVIENGIWDSSLFVFHYRPHISDWCCEPVVEASVLCGSGKGMWVQLPALVVEMQLIVWPNALRNVCVCVGLRTKPGARL